MATTLRYGQGFRNPNAKYVVRRKIKVHVYEEDGKPMVRITKTIYVGKKENDPYRINSSKGSSLANISMDTKDSTRRRYVAIS